MRLLWISLNILRQFGDKIASNVRQSQYIMALLPQRCLVSLKAVRSEVSQPQYSKAILWWGCLSDKYSTVMRLLWISLNIVRQFGGIKWCLKCKIASIYHDITVSEGNQPQFTGAILWLGYLNDKVNLNLARQFL